MPHEPLVSIVIPTRNSADFLERCLRSIKNQTYSNIEIIVVDNYSSDRTREIARRYADLVLLKGPERTAQVNFGVKHARGKYVYRVDSDFVLEPTVVEEAVKKCELEGYDAVCIHNTSDPTVSFWAKVRKLERDTYFADGLNVATRFMKKDVFEAVGGLDEKMVAAEDYDLHNRILKRGYKVGWIKAKEIHLGEPKTLRQVAIKHFYYGRTIGEFMKKNGEKGIQQLSPVRPAFLRHKKEFIRNPFLTLGFVVYQIVRYSSAVLGLLASELE